MGSYVYFQNLTLNLQQKMAKMFLCHCSKNIIILYTSTHMYSLMALSKNCMHS